MAKETNSLKRPTVKTLEGQMNDLARDKGRDVTNVFVDFLDYIIGFFNPLQTKQIINFIARMQGQHSDFFWHYFL